MAIQCQDWLRLKLPAHTIAYHIANEAKRSRATWAVQQAMGFLPGLPDTQIIAPGGLVFMIEYKAGKRALTPDQNALAEWAAFYEIPYAIVRCLDDLIIFCDERGLVPVDKSVGMR